MACSASLSPRSDARQCSSTAALIGSIALSAHFDLVVHADRCEHPVRTAFVDSASCLRFSTATADPVVLDCAAHAVVGHCARIEPDATVVAEGFAEERPQLREATVDVRPAERLTKIS